jgi:hypothetical protein
MYYIKNKFNMHNAINKKYNIYKVIHIAFVCDPHCLFVPVLKTPGNQNEHLKHRV